jgi:hypothetical protein
MDIWYWLQIVAAVIVANGLSLGWFLAAIKCHRLQKTGVKDDQLPWWVYAGLIAAPVMGAAGLVLTS